MALLVLVGVGWAVLSSPARRSRAPWLGAQVQERLERTPCAQDPTLSDAELIAALRADLRDPCRRLDALILERPEVTAWLQTQVLGTLAGPEGLRLRAAQALLRGRADQAQAGLAELETGHLGPESRHALLEVVGPDVVRVSLPYDPTGAAAALRFGNGDGSAREALAEALYAELRWPTLPKSSEEPGLAWLPAELTAGALRGLGWDSALLAEALNKLRSGRPIQTLDAPALRLLQAHGSDCSTPDPGCLALLLDQLDATAGAPVAPPPQVSGVSEEDWRRFAWAAESVRSSPSPEGRLLGLVAHPNHSYGPGPWSAGQRGDPALTLRYAGNTPAASAAAALALGQATGVQVQVYGAHSDLLVVEVGSRRAYIGPCGPGATPPQDNLPQLSADEVNAWALRERVAGLAAAGDLEGAILASAAEGGEILTPQWQALRGHLLACQGIHAPSLQDPVLAAQWAQACAQGPVQDASPHAAGTEDPSQAAQTPTCSGSLWVALPKPKPQD